MLINKAVAKGVRIGMDQMLYDYRHWLQYDSVALAVLFVGVGTVEFIVLSICGASSGAKVLGHTATPPIRGAVPRSPALRSKSGLVPSVVVDGVPGRLPR